MNTPSSRADRITALPEHLRQALARRLAGQAAATPSIPSVPRDGALPMSFGQQRLWFLEDFEPESADYHSALPLRLTGELDAEALHGALRDLVSRHEALRTTFDAVDGKGVQVVHAELHPEWRQADVSAAAPGEREQRARELVREEMARPYDLKGGPLVRVLLVKVADGEHLFILGMHHIVTDGWSMGIVARELGALYAARTEGLDAALPRVTAQYPDFAAWQRDRLENGGLLETQLDWWRERLAGLAPLDLPTDRPRPAVRSSAGATYAFEVPAATVAAVKDLARGQGATLFMALTAAAKTVLARYSGQEDIAVGTSASGRGGHNDLEQLVGFLVNTVVLRSHIDPTASFLALLGQVKDTVLDAFAHEDVPFDKLVEALSPERDTSRTPLVQAMVVLHNTQTGPAKFPGLESETYELERDAALFDLTLEFEERDGALLGLAEYSTELFDEATIARLTGHLNVLLAAAAQAPGTPVGTLPMLTDGETEQLVHGFNATGTAGAGTGLIHERLAEQAARTPDAVAVVAEDTTLTYRELDERANQLAHHLRELGAGADTLIGLSVERGAGMVVGLLGIIKAGAAYVPLDPAFPADRLAYMLQDSGARLLVTQSRVRDRLPHTDATVVDLDADQAALAARPVTAPDAGIAPGHLAYVIYTSGSTGNPKGVAIEHRNLRHICAAWDERYGLADLELRFLSVSSLSVDLFFADLIRSLPFGGALIVASKDVTTDPAALLDLIDRTGATGIEIVPSLMNAVLQEVERRGQGFPPLKLISVGSEGWRVEDCRALLRQVQDGTVVVNAYGGTEATVDSTVFVPTETALDGSVYVPIGSPLPGTRVHVLDAAMQVVPLGVPGEIYLGGDGIGRGYHGRDDLTAERFLTSPFDPADRLYRTGDRARRLPGGDLEFLGRADDQVKIRGFRIELGEVESAVLTHPDVENAAVIAHQGDDGRHRLVAYLVAARELPTGELRGHLSGMLPDYMVPAVFVPLDKLPLTPSGKVDRRNLPEPEIQADQLGTEYEAPRTATEEALAAVWAEVLGVERVGVHDNFFDLGGDSILSIQVVSRARQAGLRLTSKLLFTHQTVASLAGAVGEIAATAAAAVPQAVSGEVELTPIQAWFLAEHTVNPHHYAMSVQVELAPGTDAELLGRALAAVVAHHDALRMRYRRAGEEWIQEYGDRTAGLLSIREAGEAEEAALAAQRALNLTTGELVKGVFLRPERADGAPRLFLAVHHIVMDGVSWRVVLEDLETAYGQLAGGRPADLGAKTSSYQLWAGRLAEHTRSGGLDGELAHWKAVDPGHAPQLPTDRDGANITAHERTVSVRLGREETEALLHKVPAVYRTQVNDVLLSALGRTLSQWAGQDRIVLGLEGHGREELFEDVDLSRTVGWFTTHFPIALDLPRGDRGDWGGVLKSVKEQLRAIPGRGLGYDALRFLSRPGTPGHELRADRLPQISFNYLGQWDNTTSQDGLIRDRLPALGLDHALDEPRPYLLDVVGMVEGGALGFTWIYSGEVFDDATIERLAAQLLDGLREIVAHCLSGDAGGATPSDFPLAGLDQAGVDRIVGDGRGVADVYPLTPMQSGMLFHTLAEPDSAAYFEQMSFLVDGVRDPELLARAWQRVVDHLDILRGSVVWEGVDRPLLVVHREVEVPVTHLDWRALSPDEQATALESFLAEDRALGLDLSVAPMMRMAVIRVTDSRVRVVRTSHHVLLDGWSTSQMLDELTTAYDALAAGREPALPVRRPFGAYVEWLEGQDLAAAEAYWRELLAGFDTPNSLPYDQRPATSHKAQSAERLISYLPADLSERIYAFARQHRLTVNAVMQGVWSLLLARYSGQSDVVFGATVSGRPADLPGVDAMVGMLINTLPVRVRVTPEAPVAEWLGQVQAAQVEARQYEYVPLPQIQTWSGIERGTNLFDSLVVFENFPMDEQVPEGAEAGEAGARLHGLEGADVTNYPLNFIAYAGEELAYALSYDAELFDETTIARMAGHIRVALEGMLARPEAPLAELPMLTDAEVEQVVREFNATGGVAPEAGCIHERVAERAALTPDALAVTYGDQSLTYRELDERANQLAHHLVAQGAGPDDLIGLSVQRSTEMVVALLGIMKAGAAYVPLDPAYPADRLAYMLQDSGAKLLVTHRGLQDTLPADGITLVDLDRDRQAIGRLPLSCPGTP
ncbi:putative non-ribosomal peptide synthetase, partial [Streptomyces sp. NBRC 110611]|uniref:non-ribosomal peptide synthetase n=1 Tax=Streptomyces sp. NBRC 110611 TaxID=1621259 RepID=UPI0008578D31